LPNLSAAVIALERHCGFLSSRVRGVARQLQDADLLPLGTPGAPSEITLQQFLTLLIAVATDNGAKRLAPQAVQTYRAMSLAGLPLNSAPAGFVSAATALEVFAEMALASRQDVKSANVEFVANWPEISFVWADGSVQRYQPTGTAPGFWQTHTHRKSPTIPGAAFADAVRAVFLGRNHGTA
jgi:hypothetical protein